MANLFKKAIQDIKRIIGNKDNEIVAALTKMEELRKDASSDEEKLKALRLFIEEYFAALTKMKEVRKDDASEEETPDPLNAYLIEYISELFTNENDEEYKDTSVFQNSRMPLLDGSVYQGEIKNNLPHGQGKVIWPNGDWYEGLAREGEFWQKGRGRRTYTSESIWGQGSVFEGDWEHGFPNGIGTWIIGEDSFYQKGSVYIGKIVYGRPKGHGILRASEGIVYEGDFNLTPYGQGIWHYENGDMYEGENNIFPCGNGRYKWAGGDYYEGEFFPEPTTGYRVGKHMCWIKKETFGTGKITLSDGSKYEGQLYDYKPAGSGIMQCPNGDVYEGSFLNGVPSGKGKMHFTDGSVYEGTWDDGKQMSKGI